MKKDITNKGVTFKDVYAFWKSDKNKEMRRGFYKVWAVTGIVVIGLAAVNASMKSAK